MGNGTQSQVLAIGLLPDTLMDLRDKNWEFRSETLTAPDELSAFVEHHEYHCVVVDTGRCGFDLQYALQICGQAALLATPVLAIQSHSSKNASKCHVDFLNAGGTYMFNDPIDVDLVRAAIGAMIRMTRRALPSVIEHRREGFSLKMELECWKCVINGEVVSFTNTEYRLFALLAASPEKTLSREFLMEHLYFGRIQPGPKTLDVFKYYIRKKLEQAPGNRCSIDGRRGHGYTFKLPTASG